MAIGSIDSAVKINERQDVAYERSNGAVDEPVNEPSARPLAPQPAVSQNMRARRSFGSAQMQRQLNDQLLFPLPLPRLPLPVGMVDFTKLPGVLFSALADGLKNFGADGLEFARAISTALGGAARTVKEAGDDFGDLLKGNIGQVRSSLAGFARSVGRTLTQIDDAAGRLGQSKSATARRIGSEAAEFNNAARAAMAQLQRSLDEYQSAASRGLKKMADGAELFARALYGVLSGDGEAGAKLQLGQQMIMRGLAEIGDANETFAAAAEQSVVAIDKAGKSFAADTEKALETLAGEDRRFAEAVLRGAASITGGAVKLAGASAKATAAAGRAALNLGKNIDSTIDAAWTSVAQAGNMLSRAISGTNQTTKEFLDNTKDFREVVAAARAGDQAARAELKARWGYTVSTLPKEGTQFVDPNYNFKDFTNGQVTASKFPAKKAATQEPDLNTQLFGDGRKLVIPNADGTTTTVSNMAQYQQLIAKERAAKLGVTGNDRPMQVHVALEGGGGQGKRYLPALAEMVKLGIVPSSVTGTSVGAIAAGLVAAGADPKQLQEIVTDPRIGKFLDLKAGGRGGFFKGEEAYKFFDETLRKLTGIYDRPVTFADLKIPLHIIAAKYTDSDPPAGQEDLTKTENRTFVFGPETTPNTPVALAMRASMAIPGVFDPVEMIEPATGRKILLTDGGSLDNLPLGYNKEGLKTIALNLNEPNINHPKEIFNNLPKLPLPGWQLNAPNALLNGIYGGLFVAKGGGLARDYQERTNPPANNFVLSIPIFDLEKPRLADDGLGFPYDDKVDPRLDAQTRTVTQNFFREFFDDMQRSGTRGTNLKPLPKDTSFTRAFEYQGRNWTARYEGGHTVKVVSPEGRERTIFVGKRRMENWIIDDLAYGDLPARLREALNGGLS